MFFQKTEKKTSLKGRGRGGTVCAGEVSPMGHDDPRWQEGTGLEL